MGNRVILIDADVVAYKAASACEKATHWGDGYWTWHADENEARGNVEAQLTEIMDTLKGTAMKLCLTDSEGNFRRSILPTYKGNRANVKKPLVLKSIKEWLIEEKAAYFRPGLEGDDCMGILSTWSGLKGEKIIYSIDKDMKTIPGLFCHRLDKGVVEVTEDEADYWHLYQTLIGDTTDGYSGCPGVGPKKAETILAGSGFASPAENWAAVVETYRKAKLGPEEALRQARVARILRASDYDFTNKAPIPWTPPTL
jgi:DNA polymerase-1